MGIRRFLGMKTDEEKTREAVDQLYEEADARIEERERFEKWKEDNRATLESPTFQKAINERFGGVINARNLQLLAQDPEYMEALLAERTAEYELRMARAESGWKEYEKAHAEVEANPEDPLSWLRLAKALEPVKPEEAERCRRKAMNLREKETL